MNKQISDVLEYLYKQDKKDLAEVVLRELRSQKEIIREVHPPRLVHDKPIAPNQYGITWGNNCGTMAQVENPFGTCRY